MVTRRQVLAFTLGALLALAAASSRPVTAPEVRRAIVAQAADLLPALPDSVIGVRGWVHIRKVTGRLFCGPIDAWGCYTYDTRTMSILVDGNHWREWTTFEHEKVHMALGDANLERGVRDDAAEDIDDQMAEAIAQQRMLERLAPMRR